MSDQQPSAKEIEFYGLVFGAVASLSVPVVEAKLSGKLYVMGDKLYCEINSDGGVLDFTPWSHTYYSEGGIERICREYNVDYSDFSEAEKEELWKELMAIVEEIEFNRDFSELYEED